MKKICVSAALFHRSGEHQGTADYFPAAKVGISAPFAIEPALLYIKYPMRKAFLKPWDYIIILLSAAAVVFLSVRIYSAGPEEVVLRIDSAGGEYIYPLDEKMELEIEGPLGHTHVVIEEGRAFISRSPCADQLCVLMGDVSEAGQWAACLPNRVFISIEGEKADEEIDILSY